MKSSLVARICAMFMHPRPKNGWASMDLGLIARLFGVLFFALYGLLATAQPFDYVNLFNGKHSISIEINPPLFISGDRADEAYICSRADKYVCINSKWFNFAVPIFSGRLSKKWRQGGETYELLDSGQMIIFGAWGEFSQIQSVQRGIKYRYLYSRKYGLLGFEADIDGGLATFMSQRSRGFGFGY